MVKASFRVDFTRSVYSDGQSTMFFNEVNLLTGCLFAPFASVNCPTLVLMARRISPTFDFRLASFLHCAQKSFRNFLRFWWICRNLRCCVSRSAFRVVCCCSECRTVCSGLPAVSVAVSRVVFSRAAFSRAAFSSNACCLAMAASCSSCCFLSLSAFS